MYNDNDGRNFRVMRARAWLGSRATSELIWFVDVHVNIRSPPYLDFSNETQKKSVALCIPRDLFVLYVSWMSWFYSRFALVLCFARINRGRADVCVGRRDLFHHQIVDAYQVSSLSVVINGLCNERCEYVRSLHFESFCPSAECIVYCKCRAKWRASISN